MMPKTNRTVLVLEGTAEFREALLHGLSDSGTTAHAAGTWQEAEALLERVGSEFALAILDPNLPGDPAQGAISNLPVLPNGNWPVFLTCETPPTREQVAEAHRHGIVGYLHSQEDIEEIVLRVNAYLEGRLAAGYTSALRARVLARVELRSDGPADAEPYFALVRNISRTGMLVSVISPRAVGSKVRLSFQLPPRTTPIQCDGQIVWLQSDRGPSRGTDAGIEFEGLQPEDRQFLLHFVLVRLRATRGPFR